MSTADKFGSPLQRPRILLLISLGWAVRNFLRSEFIGLVNEFADIVVLISPGDESLERELRQAGHRVEPLIKCRYPRRYTSINGFLTAAHNRRTGFWDTALWKYLLSHSTPLKRCYLELLRLSTRPLSRSPYYEYLSAVNYRLLADLKLERSYESLFEQVQPNLVISTHPFSLDELPVTLLAKQRGIATMGVILSWDNLCYKGPLPVEHDYYPVWGETMRAELLMHKPHLADERIIVVGTPQFDFHLRPDLVWSREEFFARIGGDPSRRLITYGGDVSLVFPDEAEFVARLWRAIEDGKVQDHPQLLVRLHPHDNTDRLEEVRRRCPGVLISRPWPYDPRRFWWFTPELEHLALLSNTIRYSDVGLNVSSTITLDFAIMDKPIISIAFPGAEGNRKPGYVCYSYDIYNYRKVIELGAARLSKSFDQMLGNINFYMENPSADRAARRELVRSVCGPVDGRACQRMADAVAAQLFEHANRALSAVSPAYSSP